MDGGDAGVPSGNLTFRFPPDSGTCIIYCVTQVPRSFAPFFQEYDLTQLTPEKDAHTIIERVLQFGNRAEIRWLFTVYSREQVEKWVKRFGDERLPQPHRTFWKLVLDINP